MQDDDTEIECRICRDTEGEMVSPCLCRGSMEYVHEKCMYEWVKTKWRSHGTYGKCEVCQQPIEFVVGGLDFFLFPYNETSRAPGESSLAAILVVSVLASTTGFLISTVSELIDTNLWSVVVRWILSPIVVGVKFLFFYLWWRDSQPPLLVRLLCKIFNIFTTLGEVTVISFLTSTQITCASFVDRSTHPTEFRILMLFSTVLNYTAIALLLRRAILSMHRHEITSASKRKLKRS